VGPRAGLNWYGKPRLQRDSIPGPSSPQRVASILVHHRTKVNEWPEDGFVKAETCCLFEYVNKQVVLNCSLYVCTILV
jgi:hypothetical protein